MNKKIQKKFLEITVNDTRMMRIFSALGDDSRYRIFKILMQAEEICVSELAEILKISVPAVSQHLRILEMSDLVKHERHGQMMCYAIKQDDKFVKCILSLITK